MIEMQRLPVLILWSAIVAERLGFKRDEALTLGRAAAVARRLPHPPEGLLEPTPEDLDHQRSRLAPGAILHVKLINRVVPVVRVADQLRAISKGQPINPETVEKYISQKFGEHRESVCAAMTLLANSVPPRVLAALAFDFYGLFRPEMGAFEIDRIVALPRMGGTALPLIGPGGCNRENRSEEAAAEETGMPPNDEELIGDVRVIPVPSPNEHGLPPSLLERRLDARRASLKRQLLAPPLAEPGDPWSGSTMVPPPRVRHSARHLFRFLTAFATIAGVCGGAYLTARANYWVGVADFAKSAMFVVTAADEKSAITGKDSTGPSGAAARRTGNNNVLSGSSPSWQDTRGFKSSVTSQRSSTVDANAALLDDTKFLVLAENAEREIADHRLEQPAGDNALETYRELMTQSPNDVRVTDLGARLRALFWILWSDAVAAHRQEEADHYFDVIETSFSGVPMAPVSEPQHLDPLVVLHEVSGDSGYPTTRRVPGEPTTRRVPAEDVSPSRDVPEITSLAIRRGDELMKLGDIMAARRFYELAASAGVSRAATAVGKTFDPFYLRQAGVQGIQANLILARQWYEKAMRDGDPEAAPLLDRISVR